MIAAFVWYWLLAGLLWAARLVAPSPFVGAAFVLVALTVIGMWLRRGRA